MLYMTIGSVTVVTDVLGVLLINPHSPLAPSSHAYISTNPLLPCYNISMYHFDIFYIFYIIFILFILFYILYFDIYQCTTLALLPVCG